MDLRARPAASRRLAGTGSSSDRAGLSSRSASFGRSGRHCCFIETGLQPFQYLLSSAIELGRLWKTVSVGGWSGLHRSGNVRLPAIFSGDRSSCARVVLSKPWVSKSFILNSK